MINIILKHLWNVFVHNKSVNRKRLLFLKKNLSKIKKIRLLMIRLNKKLMNKEMLE